MRSGNRANKTTMIILSLFVAAVFLFPIYWMLITSLKTNREIFAIAPTLWPENPTLDGYVSQLTARENISVLRYFYNSLVISAESMVVTVLLASFSAYGLARFKLKINQFVLLVFLVAQMLPPVMFLVPLFQTFNQIGLLDSYIAAVINTALFTVPLGVLVLRPYFMTIPKDLEDSAIIDGCSRFGAFTRVILPLAMPGVVVVAALSFLFGWGNLIGPLTFIRSEELLPLTVNMYKALGKYGARWGEIMAYATIVTIPVFVIFVALQKRLVSGLTSGAVKG